MRQVTYFVTAGPYLKIGTTRDIARRIANIRTHCPYRVTNVLVTDQITEAEAHRGAICHTTRVGEWFRINESMSEWMLGIAGLVRVSATKRNGEIKIIPFEEAHPVVNPCKVALSALPEATKDYLIALHAQSGKPIGELIRDSLNRNAMPLAGGAA